VAWLYAVAKNKTKNHINRNRLFADKVIPQIAQTGTDDVEIDLSEKNIADSQLQMLFAICHPSISTEAQICLALRILCGFGIDEIADAFLSNKDTINKRLFRAKEKLRNEKIAIEFPAEAEVNNRLETVLLTLYLLYNEGYYSESRDVVLREELCFEAIRLTGLLIDYDKTNLPDANALLALMCFHASRFPARKDQNGEIVLYQQQDENLWDQHLIGKGAYHLHQASQGGRLSKYHLEATIAWWHTQKADTPEKWESILQLYNKLLQIAWSPIAALNRTFALAKANGKPQAIVEAEKLQLNNNHYYFVLLGELYTGIDNQRAKANFELAYTLAKTQTDKQTIQNRIVLL